MSDVDPMEVAEMLLVKYSCPKRECVMGSFPDLQRDIARFIEQYIRQYENLEQMHNAWLHMAQLEAELRKPFLQKLFGG